MKTCPRCGAQISETSKFCSECGYNFNDNAITECHDQVSSAIQRVSKPNDEPTINNKVTDKKKTALLPEVYLLLFVVAMAVLYFVPFAYFRFGFSENISLLFYDITKNLDSSIRNTINIFQIVFWIYFVIVAVTAIVLLVKGCRHNRYGNQKNANAKSKVLPISLIMQIIYVVLAVVMIFSVMPTNFEISTGKYETRIGIYFLVGVPLAFAIGTIIAIVKTKKNATKKLRKI